MDHLRETNWPELSARRVIAIRSQRDISANVSLAQLSLNGVSLSNVLFDSDGYTTESLSNVYNMLNTGIQSLYVDLYWNEKLKKFQLCPVEFENDTNLFANGDIEQFDGYTCQYGLGFGDLASQIQNYTAESDTNLADNIIILILNLKYLDTNTSYSASLTGNWNDTLPQILIDYFGESLYTQSNLERDRQQYTNNTELPDGFPTLSNFLFKEEKRIIAIIDSSYIPSNSSYNSSMDSHYTFKWSDLNGSSVSIDNTTEILSSNNFLKKSQQLWRFTYDNSLEEFTNSTVRNLTFNGYSPILNHTLSNLSDISTVFESSLWSWASGEPLTEAEARELYSNTSETAQMAFKCAAVNLEGQFHVSNCYEKKYVAYQNSSNHFQWSLSKEKHSYFSSKEELDDDTTYTFTVPKTSLQQNSLKFYLNSVSVNESIWIDLNSIAVDNCWVSGGPYASCPYQVVSSKRNFVEMLSIGSTFSLLLIFIISFLRLRKVPVRDNKKHWKKLLSQYADNDYEGVPS
ncbi:hypothetical protein WICMUC_005794 [Wickerhamomyces mucosus]|uniref:Maintenance of telomere capping protein 6 n=1 Tax=Wickerhamomyces mucosus TaxID=1378264 RepID=A0A9P8P484_9ASCO|nr:hypothetical protein WICMUC_005794 [Wickerhamomyces mucosus]